MGAGMGGILFIKRYSISHMGIASSSACTSSFVLPTMPRYVVVKVGEASSDINSIVFGGR
jgi:hypothetical protein